MKTFILNLLSNSNEASHKRLIALLSFLVLVGMVVACFFKLPINEPLAYIFAGLTLGQSSLTVAEKATTNQSDQQ